MAVIKDNFSEQAGDYAIYRPRYPEELYTYILSMVHERKYALDVATGNGQVAVALSEYFEKVTAIDISEKQISNSTPRNNIQYSIASAEQTGFANDQFDLITVGQAAHWFDLPKFYEEAKRIMKPGGLLALFGYKLPTIDAETDAVVMELYDGLLGPFWDPERALVDAGYETLWFPFNREPHPAFQMECEWTFEQLIGFLSTWSAAQHYIKKFGEHPVTIFKEKLREGWGTAEVKKINFPVFLLTTSM